MFLWIKYDKEKQKVIYNSKQGTVIYEPLDWLAAITSHIPNKGTQNVHYFGHFNLWQPQAHSPPKCEDNEIIEETIYDYNFFDYLPS